MGDTVGTECSFCFLTRYKYRPGGLNRSDNCVQKVPTLTIVPGCKMVKVHTFNNLYSEIPHALFRRIRIFENELPPTPVPIKKAK